MNKDTAFFRIATKFLQQIVEIIKIDILDMDFADLEFVENVCILNLNYFPDSYDDLLRDINISMPRLTKTIYGEIDSKTRATFRAGKIPPHGHYVVIERIGSLLESNKLDQISFRILLNYFKLIIGTAIAERKAEKPATVKNEGWQKDLIVMVKSMGDVEKLEKGCSSPF